MAKLDHFFDFRQQHLPLYEYTTEFESRYDEARDKAGLEISDVGKSYFCIKSSAVTERHVDDLKTKIDGELSRRQDLRSLAIKLEDVARGH